MKKDELFKTVIDIVEGYNRVILGVDTDMPKAPESKAQILQFHQWFGQISLELHKQPQLIMDISQIMLDWLRLHFLPVLPLVRLFRCKELELGVGK